MKIIKHYVFEEDEIKLFHKFLKENNLSYRKYGKIIGISGAFVFDLAKGRRGFTEKTYEKFMKGGFGEYYNLNQR